VSGSARPGEGGGGAATLVLAGSTDPLVVEECLRAGALGYVHAEEALPSFFEAVLTVASGRRFVAGVATIEDDPARHPPHGLSPRELQVLTCIAQGRTHYQVARILGISPHTVDTYVKRARSKLGLGNKADLTRLVMLSRAST
jgi:DNA-binding NarL/FixJ family response regulator